MKRITSLIRYDNEFKDSIATLAAQMRSSEPLPLIINGPSEGVSFAYLSEAVADMKKISGVPSLILVPTEALRERV